MRSECTDAMSCRGEIKFINGESKNDFQAIIDDRDNARLNDARVTFRKSPRERITADAPAGDETRNIEIVL